MHLIHKNWCFCPILSMCTIVFLALALGAAARTATQIRIPDTGQNACFSNTGEIPCPKPGERFWGQDAQFSNPAMAYRDNGDGSVTDLVTGLTWSRTVDEKLSLAQAEKKAAKMTLGGYSDWRLPNIKELYSLMNFSGTTGRPQRSGGPVPGAIPYINTDYFNFKYGNTKTGERYIDAQWLSSTKYLSTTMGGIPTLFGVNFADGRIKGYGNGRQGPRGEKKFYVRYVRGNAYGHNDFKENGDNTVTDQATGLMWSKDDSTRAMTWEQALDYARTARIGGYTDWRLPNAKELQYIVDYTRSPDATDSPALDPVFSSTPIVNEAGQKDWGHYWTATSHLDGRFPGDSAVTLCFGRAMGQMNGRTMDVHGAGAQRSDPKNGSMMIGRGPQGDARRGLSYARLVRGGEIKQTPTSMAEDPRAYPSIVRVDRGFEAKGSKAENNQRSNQGSSPRQPGHLPTPAKGRPGFVDRLDRDGDNRVSPSEFDGPASHFNRFDKNRDGFIAEEEAPSGPPPGRMGPPQQTTP